MGSGRDENINYLKGRQRIVNDQFGRTHVITEAPVSYDAAPIFDSSMPAVFSAQNTPHCAKVEFTVTQDLALFAFVNALEDDIDSPLAVKPSLESGIAPVGGVTAVGKLTYGTGGVSRTQLFNLAAGQSSKMPFVGSSGLFGPILVPRYYTFDDTMAGERVYRIGPGTGAPLLTNDRFNSPQQSDLHAVLSPYPVQAAALTNSATCFASIGRGAAYSGDQFPKAMRRFFGSIPTGAAGAVSTRCPWSWGSSHVRLIGEPNLQFVMRSTNQIVGGPQLTYGPYPANSYIPLRDDLSDIVVSSSAAIAGFEAAFELQYTPGV